MSKSKNDFERIFLGKDNEELTDELIKELVKTGEYSESDLKEFQEMGCTYCRPRKSFIGPLMKF